MPLVPLSCPSCGANLTVDSSKDAAICEFCGKPYIVKDAIVNNYINIYANQATIHADTVNISTQKDFEIKAGTLVNYCGEEQKVIIPDNVTEIGENAFKGLNISSVTLPNGITKISNNSFNGCKLLNSIEFPYGLKYIGEKAFCGSGLTSVNIPDSVLTVESGAFTYCRELKSVRISPSTRVVPGAFNGTPYWGTKCPHCCVELRKGTYFERKRYFSAENTLICDKCGRAYDKRFF